MADALAAQNLERPQSRPSAKTGLKVPYFTDDYLKDQGHPLKDNERLQVFLTNTLEPIEPQSNFLLPAISAEVQAAQKVKDREILVIVGNPPYSGHSKNMGAAAQALIEQYKTVDGQKLAERKHWLQ